jgi:uncharacterized protein YndB with AHSA1/START domain
VTCLIFAGLTARPAGARVTTAARDHFTVDVESLAAAPPQRAYRSFVNVASWWPDAHTISGDASRMVLDVRPGGCLCEDLGFAAGFVEHMRVVAVVPGKELRLTGGLGPLQKLAVSTSMTIRFEAVAGGSRVSIHYTVAGYAVEGLDAVAPAVERMLAEHMERFADRTVGALTE